MRTRSISNKVLKRAWYSSAPAFVISTELGIEEKNLQRRWLRLKREGVIPRNGRRDIAKSVWRSRYQVRPLAGDELNTTKPPILIAISERFLVLLRREHRP